jgi:hypothetical protein
MKVCTRCHRELQESNFYKSRHTKDSLQRYCKNCCDERSRESRALLPFTPCPLHLAWTTKFEVRDE